MLLPSAQADERFASGTTGLVASPGAWAQHALYRGRIVSIPPQILPVHIASTTGSYQGIAGSYHRDIPVHITICRILVDYFDGGRSRALCFRSQPRR